MDPLLVGTINALSLVFCGWLLLMVLRHISRSESYFDRVEAVESETDTATLREAVRALEADRDRLAARVETLEAIVTSDGFDLEREARMAGILDGLDAIEDPARRARARVRS